MKKCFQAFITFMLMGYLGVYQGHLALWYDTVDKPAKIFVQTVNMYPPQDQVRLQQGIPFSDNTELERLMEDYLS